MRAKTSRVVPGGHHNSRPRRLILTAYFLLLAGCEEEPRHTVGKPAVLSRNKEDAGSIIGQRTQEIVNAAPALKQVGVKVASTKIVAKDPITLVGNAYVTSIGRLTLDSITHSLEIWHGLNDRYPKDYDEFMTEIVKANNISLPKLPSYQEYAYDEKEHKLIIIEYPDRK
jgi:hypothetical protein